MKILEICPFSAGICGVWTRVFEEAKRLAKKGHEVYVFSSDLEKGTGNIADKYEENAGVKIFRFKSNSGFIKKSISKNVTYFNFNKELTKLKPDVVITHLLHPHSFKALKACKKLHLDCLIVTHAPFGVKRKFPLNFLTYIYSLIKVKPNLKKFSKVIAITRWEEPHLQRLGIKKEKIVYLPNGIPNEFFKQKIKKFNSKKTKIIFLGRIAPVKGIETLIKAFKSMNNKKISLEIIGPIEKGYEKIKKLGDSASVKFIKPVFSQKEKIIKMQQADIFILPSKREAMPQALIEAMALGKIVISSETLGAKDIILDGKNGFLFEIGNERALSEKINKVILLNPKKIAEIQKNARESVRKFLWESLIKRIEREVILHRK